MPDDTFETKFSEREVKLAQRRAFIAGARAASNTLLTPDEVVVAARLRFPLPKIRVPRIVDDPDGGQWSFTAAGKAADALLMYRRYPDGKFVDSHPGITLRNSAVLADLLATPMTLQEDPDDA